jgi:hypothetical protein
MIMVLVDHVLEDHSIRDHELADPGSRGSWNWHSPE